MSDFEEIYNIGITDEELIEITGEEELKIKEIPSSSDNILRPSLLLNTDLLVSKFKKEKFLLASNILFIAMIILSGIFTFIFLIFSNEQNANNFIFHVFFAVLIVFPVIIYMFFRKYVINIFFSSIQKKIIEIKKLEPSILGCLLDQVDKYNNAVKKIITAKKLLDAENKINITNLEQTANVYFSIRKDIVRALKTERILRENPEYRTTINIKSPDPIEDIHIQDIEYEELTHEAISINREIEQQLKILAIGMNN